MVLKALQVRGRFAAKPAEARSSGDKQQHVTISNTGWPPCLSRHSVP